MAHDRGNTGVYAWIKTIDAGGGPLRDDWLGLVPDEEGNFAQDGVEAGVNRHLLEHIWFTQQPRSIRKGDLLVYYAVGSPGMRFPAIVEVTDGDLSYDEEAPRWNWSLAVTPRLVVPKLSLAPSAEEIGGINPRTLRKSHSRIEPAMWERFRSAFYPSVEGEADRTAQIGLAA